MNAIVSASRPHRFLGINQHGQTAMISTTGNPDRHLVLRGGNAPNYSAADIAEAAALMAKQGISRGVMVDCSHGNSNKDYKRQGAVFRDVVEQFVGGQRAIMGLMLESNLQPGNQSWQEGVPLAYGVSITDACIGWEETEQLIREAADRLAGLG
jgi:3-deoxy-7-phosphoheptulonate synthase